MRIVPRIAESLDYDTAPPPVVARAVAASPPKPALNTPPRSSTVLTEVFERIGREMPQPPPRPEPQAASQPAPGLSQELDAPGPPPAAKREGRESLPRNRRLYRRAKLPAEIEIDGVPCTLIDVSIGGFAATGVPQFEPNALVPVTIRLTIDGIEVGTLLRARIIYVTQGRSSGRFVDLSPSQMAFLRYIVTWRGGSTGAVGTATLLDAISTGGERGHAGGVGPPSDPEAKSRWWAGLIGRKVNPAR